MPKDRRTYKSSDNSEPIKKIRLRREFTQDLRNANIFLAGCGRGQMLRAVWQPKSLYVLAVDLDPKKIAYVRYHFPESDARIANFNSFSNWPAGVEFHVADFDPYGSPYAAIENFFRRPRWQVPFRAFVTDGVPLWLGRGGMVPEQLRSERAARRPGDQNLRRYYIDNLVWPWWSDLAQRHGLRVTRRLALWKKGKSVTYYAVQLEV